MDKEKRIYERNPDTGEVRSRPFGNYDPEQIRIETPGIKRTVVYADENLQGVSQTLKVAEKFGLQVEVILAAIKIARENEDLTPHECMELALREWDCI